jgi:hypothetical protein
VRPGAPSVIWQRFERAQMLIYWSTNIHDALGRRKLDPKLEAWLPSCPTLGADVPIAQGRCDHRELGAGPWPPIEAVDTLVLPGPQGRSRSAVTHLSSSTRTPSGSACMHPRRRRGGGNASYEEEPDARPCTRRQVSTSGPMRAALLANTKRRKLAPYWLASSRCRQSRSRGCRNRSAKALVMAGPSAGHSALALGGVRSRNAGRDRVATDSVTALPFEVCRLEWRRGASSLSRPPNPRCRPGGRALASRPACVCSR